LTNTLDKLNIKGRAYRPGVRVRVRVCVCVCVWLPWVALDCGVSMSIPKR